MQNILYKYWLTTRAGTVGFIIVEDKFGNREIRISSVSGIIEAADIDFIKDWGARMDISHFEEMVSIVKKKRRSGQGRKKKYSEETVEKIRWLYHNSDLSMAKIAQRFKINEGTINDIISKKGAYDEKNSS
jgi:hypothetical protein